MTSDYRLFCGQREECANNDECARESKANALRFLDDIMRMRTNPDLTSLAAYLDAKLPECGYDDARLLAALRKDMRKYQKRVIEGFPAARSLCPIFTWVSIPVAMYGLGAGNGLLEATATGLVALSEAVGLSLDSLTEKYRWTTVVAKNTDYSQLAKYDL